MMTPSVVKHGLIRNVLMEFHKPQGCVNVKRCFDSVLLGYLGDVLGYLLQNPTQGLTVDKEMNSHSLIHPTFCSEPAGM